MLTSERQKVPWMVARKIHSESTVTSQKTQPDPNKFEQFLR